MLIFVFSSLKIQQICFKKLLKRKIGGKIDFFKKIKKIGKFRRANLVSNFELLRTSKTRYKNSSFRTRTKIGPIPSLTVTTDGVHSGSPWVPPGSRSLRLHGMAVGTTPVSLSVTPGSGFSACCNTMNTCLWGKCRRSQKIHRSEINNRQDSGCSHRRPSLADPEAG